MLWDPVTKKMLKNQKEIRIIWILFYMLESEGLTVFCSTAMVF